ncbi:alpha/beta hydrolase family protein [Streptantibioticus ferralitis]|uniref:Alpha/beta hydrolase n=1 Tax=Streptantibioticus ferralitis TaxID=236510 RepID=A0ABT5YUI0_9ACTN|nr:alpha/beta hydrolase [Streptantibioticus ferralitis]MDF2255032.1 alpha/beta hydrolase [Streptantibioticus ferralitis]
MRNRSRCQAVARTTIASGPPRPRRATKALVAVGTAAALAVAAGGCSSGASTPAPGATRSSGHPSAATPDVRVTDHTYQVPRPLPPGAPGALIAATDHGPDRLVGSARRWTVLYHSVNAHHADVPVSGTVLVPQGTPPPGGWPVVSWGHGTTGVADSCAPSQTPNLGFNEYAQELRAFVRAGYAVAASDYPGLGTPGMHTYLVGADEGNAVVDIVTAARQLAPTLAPTWFAVGHSQGGQAALFAANAAHRSAGLHLGGTVAIAPASHLESMLPGVIASHQSSELSFALYSLAGLSATDPSVNLRSLLGASAARTAARVLAQCLKAGYTTLSDVTTEQTLPLSGEQLRRVGSEMGAYGDPDRTAIHGPVLVIQGGADQDVPPQWTSAVVHNLRSLGSPAVVERTYPGLDHDQVLGQSVCDLLTFLGSHGGRSAANCAPFQTGVG